MSEPRIDDVRTETGRELYVVRPSEPSGSAVLYLHWFDEAPNANRSQFLGEAKDLAELGVTSVLPQLTFPWHSPPTDSDSDLARIVAEVEDLARLAGSFREIAGIDPQRLAVVGHDFGGMYGTLLLRKVPLACAVLIAATPRWSDWFLRFWPIAGDRFDYMRSLDGVDPIRAVTEATCPTLFQFGKGDFYIAPMTGSELFNAAPEPKQLITYESDHEMAAEQIARDRGAFLSEHLALG